MESPVASFYRPMTSIAASTARVLLPLPLPLPRLGAVTDGATLLQRRLLMVAVLGAHAAGVWGLMQVREVREAVIVAAPIFVEFISPSAPPVAAVRVPALPALTLPLTPIHRKPPPAAPVIAVAATPEPAAFAVPAPSPPEPAPALTFVPAAPAPLAMVAVPAPVLVPLPDPTPAPPTIIPASAVQYLEAPVLDYPRLSRRNGEAGRVMVRVYIDTAGLPRNVQVSTTSGHVRLDDAAVAAVQKTRFKPYTQNGQPTAGWASIPINFELEK